jgi:anti-anti-sigma factor
MRNRGTGIMHSTPKREEALELSDKHVDSTAVLNVTGRIDMTTSDAFRERLVKLLAAGKPLVVDMSGVSYISSAGLRALMIGSRQAHGANTRLAVAAPQPVVMEIFKISRFDKVLSCHSTVEAALAAVKQQ